MGGHADRRPIVGFVADTFGPRWVPRRRRGRRIRRPRSWASCTSHGTRPHRAHRAQRARSTSTAMVTNAPQPTVNRTVRARSIAKPVMWTIAMGEPGPEVDGRGRHRDRRRHAGRGARRGRRGRTGRGSRRRLICDRFARFTHAGQRRGRRDLVVLRPQRAARAHVADDDRDPEAPRQKRREEQVTELGRHRGPPQLRVARAGSTSGRRFSRCIGISEETTTAERGERMRDGRRRPTKTCATTGGLTRRRAP